MISPFELELLENYFLEQKTKFLEKCSVLRLTYSTSLVAILYLLRENVEDLFEFEEASQPRIQCDKSSADMNVISEGNTSYYIMVERFRLTSTKDFIKVIWCVDVFVLCLQLRIYKESGRIVHIRPKTLFKHQWQTKDTTESFEINLFFKGAL